MRKVLISFIAICFTLTLGAQQNQYKCYPTNWWTGMKNPKLQLMVHAKGIGNAQSFIINYPGVKVEKVNKVENKNYVFIDLTISSSTRPGTLKVKVSERNSSFE